jgi:hypothetical protein
MALFVEHVALKRGRNDEGLTQRVTQRGRLNPLRRTRHMPLQLGGK